MYEIVALSGPNKTDSFAYATSAAGDAAGGGWEPAFGGVDGMIWREGSFDFSLASGSDSILYGVNSSGDAVGIRGLSNTDTEIPVLVRGHLLHDLEAAVGKGAAWGINDSGIVCGSSLFGVGGNKRKGFVYDSNAKKVILWIDSPGENSVHCINAAGELLGGRWDGEKGYEFYYDGSFKELIGATFAADLNDVGIVCGSMGGQPWAPAVWDAKTDEPSAKEVPVPPGFVGGHGNGINNQGDVVGHCWDGPVHDWHAFVCFGVGRRERMLSPIGPGTGFVLSVDLNTLISDPAWHLEAAHAINDKGHIVGDGIYNGQRTAFLMWPRSTKGARFDGRLSLPQLVGTLLGGPAVDGGGWNIVGGIPVPVDPWGPWVRLNASKRDALVGLAMDEIAMCITDRGTREKLRSLLLEEVRASMDRLMKTVAEGRTPPVGAARAAGAARPIRAGMTQFAARRFPFHGRTRVDGPSGT